MILETKAYAKINLTLEIIGKRADGFHDIASVMHKIPLCDDVSLDVTEGDVGIVFACDRDVCPPEKNLAYRAAELFLRQTGLRRKVAVTLRKHIPAGAGLAGGSTDGAAVLDLMNEACGRPLSEQELETLAAGLGSDVPFCLAHHTCALCTGRGEIMTELPALTGVRFYVACPRKELSTAGIYGEYDRLYGEGGKEKENSRRMASLLQKGVDVREILALMINDFQPLCEAKCGEIAVLCDSFRQKGYYAQMSGSGSSVFGIEVLK